MLGRIIRRSLANRKRAALLMVASTAAGTAVIATFAALAVDVEGKVRDELRAFGANIVVEPRLEGLAELAGEPRFLRQADLPKAKTIFWRHSIVGLAPLLEVPVEVRSGRAARRAVAVGTWVGRSLKLPGGQGSFPVGIDTVLPWWQGDTSGLRVGRLLAAELGVQPGDALDVAGRPFAVAGLIATGGDEDHQLFLELEALQRLTGLDGKLSRVRVSALTAPMDDFAYQDWREMTPAEYEKWYCTGYVTSIARQLEEVFAGSRAKPVWRVAEAEGEVLGRLGVLVYVLTAAIFLAAALGMATTMTASFVRRRPEVALMKSLGAESGAIQLIVLSEALLIGVVGGAIGYAIAVGTVDHIGLEVFGVALERKELLIPLCFASALAIAVVAAVLPIRRALAVKPATVLKEVA